MKERKSFVAGALGILLFFWISKFASFIICCVRGTFENGGVLNLVSFILGAVGVGLAIYFLIKNDFEVNGSVVALVALTSIVFFVLPTISSIQSITSSNKSLHNSINDLKSIPTLSVVNDDAIHNLETSIASNNVSLVFTIIENLLPLVLVVLSNDVKKTVEQVKEFFKGLVSKKASAK